MWLDDWIDVRLHRSGSQSVLIKSEALFLNASEHHHFFKVYIAHFKIVSNFLPVRADTALLLESSGKYNTSLGTATPECC